MAGNLRDTRALGAWMLPLLLASLSGCGPAGPDVQMIKGLVTLDGEPVDGATVIFVPEAEGLMAAGKTDAAGTFAVNASQGQKYGRGTIVGDYIVTVSKLSLFVLDPVTGEPTDIPAADPKQLLPETYTTALDSPLRATVVKGRNEFHFDLQPEP